MRLFSSSTRADTLPGRPPPEHDFWYTKLKSIFGGNSVTADPDNAKSIPAVYACVRVLSLSAAQLPLIMYRKKDDDSRERATFHPLSNVLRFQPNRWQHHFKWVQMMFGHILMRGNCFSQVVRNERGDIRQLIPLNPTRVTVEQTPRGYLRFVYSPGENKPQKIFTQDEMFYCTSLTTDGLVGLSPIAEAKRAFELAMATEEYGAKLFENRAQPSGILKLEGSLKDKDAVERLKKTWGEANTGVRNTGKVAILENGLEWQQIGMTSHDSQWIESRRFDVEQIARIFGVPPHKIGDLSKATFSNIEQQDLDFVKSSLMPWLKNFEEALAFFLLSEDEQKEYYIEFLIDGLLRGDYKTRQEGLAIQRQNGIITTNEWRKFENYNPLKGDEGDILLINGNMVPVKDAGKHLQMKQGQTLPGGPAPQPTEGKPNNAKRSEEAIKQQFLGVFRDIAGKALRREEKALETVRKRGNSPEQIAEFRANQLEFSSRSFSPMASLYLLTLAGDGPLFGTDAFRAIGDELGVSLNAYLSENITGEPKSTPIEKRQSDLAEGIMRLIEKKVRESTTESVS